MHRLREGEEGQAYALSEMMGSLGFREVQSKITVFRGQRTWFDGMNLTASSTRKATGVLNPTQWTESLLQLISGFALQAAAGPPGTGQGLEWQLLFAQQTGSHNPFVSCTHERAVALEFACPDNQPGYVLTIEADWNEGFDFEFMRNHFNLFGDNVHHLREFGIPRALTPPFVLAAVDRFDPVNLQATRIFP